MLFNLGELFVFQNILVYFLEQTVYLLIDHSLGFGL